MTKEVLVLRPRRPLATATLVAGLAVAAPPAASAHYINPDASTAVCTRDWSLWGGQARSTSEPGVPGIGVKVTGSDETGYRYSGATATPVEESHVRMVDETLVADVGAYPAGGVKAVNEVTVTGAGRPSSGRTITGYCRFFDDPYREGAYDTPGSREHTSGAAQGHHYTQPGFYHPWMHALDSAGAWSLRGMDERGALYVNGPPTAAFSYSDPARVGTPVSFDAAESHDWLEPGNRNQNGVLHENGPLTYEWDLDGDSRFNQAGDRTSGSASARTATFTYTSSAARMVRLRVADRFGTQRIATQSLVFDNLSPRAGFSVSPASPEAGQMVSFASSSSDPDGTIAAHAWDLNGDGSYDDASGGSVSSTFPIPGRYPVSLRVTDNGGRQATVQQTVVVSPRGTASAAAGGVAGSTASRRFLAARIRLRASLTRVGARLRTLAVASPRGAIVRVRCAGGGCKTKRQTARSRGKLLRLKRFQRPYRAGAMIRVYVTKPGSIGRYVRIKIRKGRAPLRTDLCLKSDARRPSRC